MYEVVLRQYTDVIVLLCGLDSDFISAGWNSWYCEQQDKHVYFFWICSL